MTFYPGSTAPPPCSRTGTGKQAANHQGGSKTRVNASPASPTATQGFRPAPLWSHLALAALPTAPACARLHAKQMLWEWGLANLSEIGELIVSELVTNAVQITAAHGLLTPIRLWLSSYRQHILIEIWDADPQPPALKAPDADGLPSREAEGGRGLFLVANLSERWGWYPDRGLGGKVVWAVVAK